MEAAAELGETAAGVVVEFVPFVDVCVLTAVSAGAAVDEVLPLSGVDVAFVALLAVVGTGERAVVGGASRLVLIAIELLPPQLLGRV